MDQTLSLTHPTSPSSALRSAQAAAATAPPEGSAAEEEPESPGRSPRQVVPPAGGADPLAEGIALIAGMLLAVLAVLVPLATVVSDSHLPESSETVRAAW